MKPREALPEISDQAVLLRQIQEVDEEVHARLRFLHLQTVDSSEERQRVADGELVVQSQLLWDTQPTVTQKDERFISDLRRQQHF